jgi:hypothetical protein
MTTTVSFNECGTYLSSWGGSCDVGYWDGTNFIDSGSANSYPIFFIPDEDRGEDYPPYTLTSLRVVVDLLGGSGLHRIDLYLDEGAEQLTGAENTADYTFYFDPPIASSRLYRIAVIQDYIPTKVTIINATGSFGSAEFENCCLTKVTGLTQQTIIVERTTQVWIEPPQQTVPPPVYVPPVQQPAEDDPDRFYQYYKKASNFYPPDGIDYLGEWWLYV